MSIFKIFLCKFLLDVAKIFPPFSAGSFFQFVTIAPEFLIMGIKGNFEVKKIENKKPKDQEELEALIRKSGGGSHMVFRSENKDEELFVDEL